MQILSSLKAFASLLSLLALPSMSQAELAQSAAVANASVPLLITKINPTYWRATFDTPPLNIEDTALYEALYALIDDIANDTDVKVIVFDSRAKYFWSAHFDVVNGVPQELTDGLWANLTRLSQLPVVTIAAIRGIVRGGSLELAAALDIRFGSKEKAIFNQIEVGVGLDPSSNSYMLPRLIGRSRALEMVMSADDYDADIAAQYGLINRAIPDADFDGFIDGFARRVAGWDHHAIANAKGFINSALPWPTNEEVAATWDAFRDNLQQPSVQARLPALVKAGLQTNVTFEINAATEILRFVGDGPF